MATSKVQVVRNLLANYQSSLFVYVKTRQHLKLGNWTKMTHKRMSQIGHNQSRFLVLHMSLLIFLYNLFHTSSSSSIILLHRQCSKSRPTQLPSPPNPTTTIPGPSPLLLFNCHVLLLVHLLSRSRVKPSWL